MRKLKLMIFLAAFVSMVSVSSVSADYAPGEGLYIGGFVGHGGGHVKAKTSVNDITQGDDLAAPAAVDVEIKDGGIGLEGMEFGAIVGYGYKMGDLYIGLEGDYAGGGPEFKIETSRDIALGSRLPGGNSNHGQALVSSKMSVDTKYTVGGGGRIGLYLNKDTLLTFKGGVAASKAEVIATAALSEEYWIGGPRLGIALDTRVAAVDPNLSLRLSWDYTDYITAPISGIGAEKSGNGLYNSEVTGAAYNARVGLLYSFFDVNSLF